MAVNLLTLKVSDLCLGKPPLKSLSLSATVGDALSALKRSGEISLSVWTCDHRSSASTGGACRCVGKVCVADVICFLCREENLARPPMLALDSPLSDIVRKAPEVVRHLEPDSSILEAVDCVLEGVQNLIVPKRTRAKVNTKPKLLHHPSLCSTLHGGREFCWITQEDMLRFFLNSINLFSPTPTQSIDSLDIINGELLAVEYEDPALSALPMINDALINHTAVAVTDEEGKLMGEISPHILNCCDETVSAAIATLSAGDLMAYIDCYRPPEDLVHLVKERLEDRNLEGMLEIMGDEGSRSSMNSSLTCSSSSSSDDEACSVKKGLRWSGSGRLTARSGSGRMTSRTEAIVCHPASSLVAVMIKVLAHRATYVWVVERDFTLVGIVTFGGMLKVFRDRISTFF